MFITKFLTSVLLASKLLLQIGNKLHALLAAYGWLSTASTLIPASTNQTQQPQQQNLPDISLELDTIRQKLSSFSPSGKVNINITLE